MEVRMFAVHAEAASDVRRLLDRQSRETVLGRPHCAFLMCLFRSLDDNAVEFLNTFAEAIDTETGEAVMMIVLFDSVGILGESAAHHMSRTSSVIPPASERPLLQCEAVLKGAREVDLFFSTKALTLRDCRTEYLTSLLIELRRSGH
jgi:hypothetical protein